VLDPNDDDECVRLTFPFYLNYAGVENPPPASLEVSFIRIEFQIEGDGYVDENLTNDDYTYGYFVYTSDPKTFYWFTQDCQIDPPWTIDFGSCQSPLMNVVVIAEPGAQVTLNTTVAAWFLPTTSEDCDTGMCSVTSNDPNETKDTPSDCSSDLYLTLDGIPAGDPGDEVQLNLTLHNDGSSAVTISELDFRIKIDDVYENLGGVALDPNTNNNNPPANYYNDGDEYYFLLNDLDPSNTLDGHDAISILGFAIAAPEGVENILGEADTEVLSARINIDGGDCCLLDDTEAEGVVIFPGELPCDGDLDDIEFVIGPYLGQLDECEIGFAVYISSSEEREAERILIDLETILSGSMEIEDVSLTGGLEACENCLTFTANTIIYDFDDSQNPLDINDDNGDGFLVVLDGLNGSLEYIEFNQAAIEIVNEGDACVPEIVYDQNLDLPLESACDYCDNLFIGIGEYSPGQESLEDCENGFSIYLSSTDSPPDVDRIMVDFKIKNPEGLTLEVSSALCGTNQCQPAGSGGQEVGNCIYWYPSTGIVRYQYCPVGFTLSPENLALVDIKFSDLGCIPDVVFNEETQVHIYNDDYCNPVLTESENPLPLCTTNCEEETFSISGNIRFENESDDPLILGHGVYVSESDPDAGVFFVSETYEDNEQPQTFSGCPDKDEIENLSWYCKEVTATMESGTSCGDYDYSFECGDDDEFIIKPINNKNPLNGVTTFDLVLITKHILGVQYLDSPYKIIAADANKSNSVTTFDLVEIRKLILFIITEYQNNTSWRFIPASWTFSNPSNPFASAFPECIHVDLSSGNSITDVDFIAIKIGDVNGSALNDCTSFTGDNVEERSERVHLTAVNGPNVQAGEEATVDFWMASPHELVSWELGLRFDPRYLQFKEAVPGNLEGMDVSCFGTTQADEGKLRVLWVAPYAQPQSYENGFQAFNLRFKILRPINNLADVMVLDDAVLPDRAYEADGTVSAFQLDVGTESSVAARPSEIPKKMTVTAVPNPFSGELRFFISVPEDDWVELSVFDVNGRLVASWSGETVSKEKEVFFGSTEDWGTGVFTYRVRTARHSVSGKITKQ
jgi:hypothetical protein